MMKVLGPCEDETGTHFNFNKIRMIDDLLSLAKDDRQRRDLYKWIQTNFREMHSQFMLSEDVRRYDNHRIDDIKNHMVQKTLHQIVELIYKEGWFVLEEESPLEIRGGYVVGRHPWAQRGEQRFLVSTGFWGIPNKMMTNVKALEPEHDR